MLALLVFSGITKAQESVDKIDLEVVVLLSLNKEQAIAYSSIMQQQRAEFRALKPAGWSQQKIFYEKTLARLKPVLTEEQHIRFVAYMDSFLEEIPDESMLAME
jgi:hypothetical protein